MAKIDVVRDEEGDWEAIYIDGEAIAQNHSVDWSYLIEQHLIGKTIHSLTVWHADLSELGWAPQRLDEFEDGELTPA